MMLSILDLLDYVPRSMGGANLREANLREANLRWADLRRANLEGANLYGAYLRGAIWDKYTHWPDGFIPPKEATKGTNHAKIHHKAS